MRIIVAPVPMPAQFVSDLPQSFDRWWEKASQRDPAERFQSAREFGDALAMAFGHSKGLSGEGDRWRARAIPGPAPYPAAGQLPFGSTPHPGFGNTPNPVFGNTPQPPYGGTQPLQAMGPTTGAAMSRTFDAPPSARPKSKGTAVVIGGASVVVLALAILGATFALKGKDAPVAPVAAASAPTPPAALPPQPVAAAAPSPVAPPAPPPAVVAVETPPTANVAPTVAPSPPAATPSVKPAHALAPPSHPSAPPPAAPTANKKVKVDLGI